MTDILEKADVGGAQGKTDGMIENLVVEVCSMCFAAPMAWPFNMETLFPFSWSERVNSIFIQIMTGLCQIIALSIEK